MIINSVAWAVPPQLKSSTRPVRLVHELLSMGVIDRSADFYFHGRAGSQWKHSSVGVVTPWKGIPLHQNAVLSPVFGGSASSSSVWSDFYDDWSLAPDINPWHRLIAKRTYAAVAHQRAFKPMTVNSEYMALKLNLPLSHVVPNGVDPAVGKARTSGDNRRRLILLGHFFKGRTDFDLLAKVLEVETFDEVIIGSPGKEPAMRSLISQLRRRNVPLAVEDWISTEELAKVTGPRTIALIPHVVNDYTLSQDMMKIYTFMSLGIRVICPRLLWPSHLENTYAFLYDFGVSLPHVLPDWIDESAPAQSWRERFGEENSWRRRAEKVTQVIGSGNA